MRGKKKAVPENICEEYYQISGEILASFPKYRPPVDFYRFREDILSLAPFSRKGQRLTNEQVEEAQELCDAGNLFVSRSDHPIYSEHIVKQLDLVLQDANLKDSEIADICTRAIVGRFTDFAQQPVKLAFEPLYKDVMVLTEWLWQDKFRIKYFVRRMFREHSEPTHAFNTLAIGLWLWMECQEGEFRRRDMDRVALALLLHDIGMVKIPQFILAKPGTLKGDEREKVLMHPLVGYKLMQRIELVFDELTRAIMEHHERLDGSGYPQRAKGDQISRLGRITALADSFSAMVTKRPYASAMEPTEAAKALSGDRARYDSKLAGMLAMALANDAFGEARNVSLAEEENAEEDEASNAAGEVSGE